MPVIYAKINNAWVPINFATPPEVFIGNTTPTGNETMWIDTSTTPPTTKAFVSGAWVTVGAIAPDEVWVGPSDPMPANPVVELWYDTDAGPVPAAPGSSLPVGGTVGQVLRKQTATDYDAAWGNQPPLMQFLNRVEAITITGIAEPTPSAAFASQLITTVTGETLHISCLVEGYSSNGAGMLQLLRDGTSILNHVVGSNVAVPCSQPFWAVDAPVAGTHTYALRIAGWYGSTVQSTAGRLAIETVKV